MDKVSVRDMRGWKEMGAGAEVKTQSGEEEAWGSVGKGL